MKTQIHVIQSFLRGAFASVLFSLLAVSVSENAEAQMVQVCGDNSRNTPGIDPHTITTSCTGSSPLLNSEPTHQFCGGCTSGSRCGTDNLTGSIPNGVPYTYNGRRYCGLPSQCNAVGGTRNGVACTCDSGNLRLNGVCTSSQAASDCTQYETLTSVEADGGSLLLCRPTGPSNCGIGTEFNAAPEGTEGGTCDPCGTGEESDGGENRCECQAGYDRLNATECTNAHHEACFNADPAMPIATSIFTTDRSATPGAGDCRTAEDTDEDLAVCNGIVDLFSRIEGGACSRGSECTGSQYNILAEVSNTDTDAGTCISEGGCARIVDGFPEMRAGGNVCRLARNDEECSRILELQSQGSLFGRITDVGAQYDAREEHHCRPRIATDCPEDYEFVATTEVRVGGTCEACARWEASIDGNACAPRIAANCASNFQFFEITGGGICELRVPGNCDDGYEFMEDPGGGGTCEMCDTNEVSMSGAACECPDTHFPESADSCVDRMDPSNCPNNTQFVDPDTNECAPCRVENHVRVSGNTCACPTLYFEEVGVLECSPRVAANCPADHEFEPAPDGADGGTCERCDANEVSSSGAPCECADGLIGDAASETCRAASGSAECRDNLPLRPIFSNGICRAASSSAECRDNFPSLPIFSNGICEEATTDDQCQDQHPDFPIRNGARCDATLCAFPALVVEGVCKPLPECTAPETPNAVNDCECQFPALVVEGVCKPRPECTAPETPNEVNDCECQRPPNVVVNGVCEVLAECVGEEVRNTRTNRCECRPPNVEVNGGCEARVSCTEPLIRNEQNECYCDPETHFGDATSCVDHTECGNNAVRDTADNTCACANGFDNTGTDAAPICERSCGDGVRINGVCHAPCGPNQTRGSDSICACNRGYEDPNAEDPNYTGELVCLSACREDQIRDEADVCVCPQGQRENESGVCACPQGQRENTDRGGCEGIPASGGGGSSGDAAAALVAVPFVLIGGYYFLGGVDYVDPAYSLDYSGENGNLDWRGNAGFNLQHGGLRSYANAIQSNGDAVSYESGISYEEEYLSLTYDAAESESEYLYDLGVRLRAEFGVWTIAPAIDAGFEYRLDEGEWNAESSAGLTAAWTAHRWKVKARSDFAGASQHGLDLELRF